MALCSVIGLAAISCGGDKDKGKYYVPPGRGGKDAGEVEEKDSGPAPIKDAGMSEGPELSFTMLDPASDPNEDTVVTTPQVTVHCIAKQRRAKVDESTVSIKIEKFDDESKDEVQPPTTKVGEDEYQAKFDVSARPNGVLKFTCTAKDVAMPANTSTLTMQTLLDLGPKIELLEPKDKGIYALRTPVTVKFKVTAQPLAEDDKEADVKDVKLKISGMEQPITESEDSPGTYQTTVDFNDKTLFMVPPTSSEVLVTASNGRTPDAPTRSVKADVKIDGDGPTIKIDAPTDGEIVHGEVVLKLTINDVSGVKPGSVFANINADALKITDWDVMGSSYQHTFDTRTFGYEITQLTINVSATDVVGNQTDPAASITLKLDNRPPLLSLDPPLIREYRKINASTRYCSEAFDPVGNSAQNDKSTATVASYYRVFIEDQTNHAPGSMVDYHAGVDKNKVVLYAQKDPSVPLLIDTNGDSVCDEIEYADLPEAKRPPLVKLTALEPRGSANYPFEIMDNGPVIPGPPPFCIPDPSHLNPPDTVCPLTEMFRVIPSALESKPPAIYALSPTNGGTGECEGIAWNVLGNVGEGWRCLAARAEDTIGNVGVSAPLRVCFDNGNAGDGTPNCDQSLAPACTKNCMITDEQKFPNTIIREAR